MPQQGFIFGGSTPWSYDQLQQKRRIAEALAANIGSPRNVGEGLSAVGRALAARGLNKRADAREAELRREFDADWAGLFGGSGGAPAMSGAAGGMGTYTPPPRDPSDPSANLYPVGRPVDPNAAPTPEYPVGQAVEPNVRELVVETANALGMSPHDLATIVSYETGGTFNPTQAGPTTQHGQHRGLIQFGEPQAEQYGVDWGDPIRSQLGADGAIVRYFQDNGWQPGMGLLDGYSIVNAGGPGRYNATDAHNGGAPGTVADKVNSQMAGHRQNATRFLGGAYTPGGDQVGAGQIAGMDLQALANVAGSPFASAGQRAVVNALLQQRLQAQDPMYQMQLEQQRLELDQMRNPAVDPMDAIKLEMAQLELDRARSPERERVEDVNGRLRYTDTGDLVFPNVEVSPEDTTTQRDYQFYADQERLAGREPKGFNDWRLEGRRAGATTVNVGDGPQATTVGQEALDKAYADEHLAWTRGGAADMNSQIAQLEGVAASLEGIASGEGNGNLTGAVIGNTPDWVSSVTNPSSIDARERVEEVVQRNLRIILGAQFTEKEGERLISRAYNPRLGEAENASRLRKLIGAMRAAAQARQEQADYFTQHGTLSGWQGKSPTIDDFHAAMDGETPPANSSGEVEQAPVTEQAIPPAPPPPEGFDGDWEALWKHMTPEERAVFQ